jgi:uracil-DNA glycosylase
MCAAGQEVGMPRREKFPSAAPFLPGSLELPQLRVASEGCEGCDLYKDATQTVFGTGSATAELMLVGEQPGDVEDRSGEPFVGPAGKLLDRALDEAGIDRSTVWLTNAVKHFRFKRGTGPRRIHAKPDVAHVTACRPWLVAELAAVRPAGIVALGATAAQGLLGSAFRLTEQRGTVLDWPPPAGPFAGDGTGGQFVVATIHPSAVLRADSAQRADSFAGLVADLRVAAAAVAG